MHADRSRVQTRSVANLALPRTIDKAPKEWVMIAAIILLKGRCSLADAGAVEQVLSRDAIQIQ